MTPAHGSYIHSRIQLVVFREPVQTGFDQNDQQRKTTNRYQLGILTHLLGLFFRTIRISQKLYFTILTNKITISNKVNFLNRR